MNRFIRLLTAALAAVFLLSGCEKYPTQTAEGTAWDRNWTILGTILGIEEPGNGFVLQDNNTALNYKDIYYATWTSGEPSPYTNEDGEEVDLYEAQIYLLIYGCKDQENAEIALKEWTEREEELYQSISAETQTINDQEYTLYSYEISSDTNPFSRGISAFAVRGNYAISAELTCQADYQGNVSELLTSFLNGCHYSADLSAEEAD